MNCGLSKNKTILRQNQDGFTLLEVMIALTIFTVFITAYISTQGYNITDSNQMRQELILGNLAQNVLRKIMINPPEFRNSLTLSPTVKTFEKHPNFEYSVEYKKFKLPDLKKMTGGSSNDDEESSNIGNNSSNNSNNKMSQMVLDQVKENLEKAIWQVRIIVKNKETGLSYIISSWLLDDKAKIKFKY